MDDDKSRLARKLLCDVLDYTVELEGCNDCVGPGADCSTHKKRWLNIKKKIKQFLASAPN